MREVPSYRRRRLSEVAFWSPTGSPKWTPEASAADLRRTVAACEFPLSNPPGLSPVTETRQTRKTWSKLLIVQGRALSGSSKNPKNRSGTSFSGFVGLVRNSLAPRVARTRRLERTTEQKPAMGTLSLSRATPSGVSQVARRARSTPQTSPRIDCRGGRGSRSGTA